MERLLKKKRTPNLPEVLNVSSDVFWFVILLSTFSEKGGNVSCDISQRRFGGRYQAATGGVERQV